MDPKAKRAEQWISDGMGGRVSYSLAKVGVCAATIGNRMPLSRGGDQNVYTDMEYPVVHRMAAAQKRGQAHGACQAQASEMICLCPRSVLVKL